ncbi:MAG: nucleotidyltransferase domain-containing protein [Thermodesulfobacteriota bacterium]
MQDYERYLTDAEREGVKGFIERLKWFLGASLLELRIFGSKVRGDFDRESDIDIFVVIDSDDWHIREAISNIAANVNIGYNCNISPVIYTKKEHEKNRYFQIMLIQEVEREGVSLA